MSDGDKTGKLHAGDAVYRGDRGGHATESKVETGAASGDDRHLSFEQIYRKYGVRIYNFILRQVKSHEDAEDLTVDTFTNAYRHWDRFRGDARVYTWLYQIANNNCKNYFKQKDRQREREPFSLDEGIETDSGELGREVADWSAAPEQRLLERELETQVRRAVDALPLEYRSVLLLAQEDLPYDEIAKITGLSVPAVKTRLHRARLKVRQRLDPYLTGWMARQRDREG